MSHYGYIGAPEDEPGYWDNHGPDEQDEREEETEMTTGRFIIVTEIAPDDYRVRWSYRNEPACHFDTKDAALEFVARQVAEDHASVLVIDDQQEVEI